MDTTLGLKTVIVPLFSVYLPVVKHAPVAVHQEVDNLSWMEYATGYAFPRPSTNAMELARMHWEINRAKESA